MKKYRVLDLTNVLAGPYCCHLLAHLGCEVIKVENPSGGDLARQLGASINFNKKKMGISFLAQNAGKKSIAINIKSKIGKDIFFKLVKKSDVIVENFKPGTIKKLGIGFSKLKKINKKIILASISGFGQNGSLSKLPAYDQIIQGYSGVMSITGKGKNIFRVGYPVADTIGGLNAALAITSLLNNKNRKASHIDISMLDSVISSMGWVVSNYLNANVIPKPLGNENFTASPSGTFKTKNGMINIAANRQSHFEGVCIALNLKNLIKNKKFCDRQNRLKNRKLLKQIIEKKLLKQKTNDWVKKFQKFNVPCGPILSIPEILKHNQIKSRKIITSYKIKGFPKLKLLKTSMRINNKINRVKSPPPKLGQNTNSIMRTLGYTSRQITTFKKEKIINE
ncbi:CaiB/BaiF CoA transferase family protein [Candidatus Pelagibacter sp. HIMB1517]|uniref:CaiB/BaiF CoA transferase family protein n=1 Tax=Candidatus Pelagibacter sp. HIMB1517 TaxID=3413341 RepID=UPI003F828BCE